MLFYYAVFFKSNYASKRYQLYFIYDQSFSHIFIRFILKMQCKTKEENLTSYHKLRVIIEVSIVFH